MLGGSLTVLEREFELSYGFLLFLLLWNDIVFLILMNEQHAVLRSNTCIAVHSHSRLEHVGARRQISLFAAIKGVTPSPRQAQTVIITSVSVDRRDVAGGEFE
jgi:hypothetical protein